MKDFDPEREGEFLVVDVIDGDLFIRVKEMQGKFQSCLGMVLFLILGKFRMTQLLKISSLVTYYVF